uniref:Uncharacterized protein n=1 Tax=Acrobeloides nanus TaxID=290746 RepID=A0A914CJY0_9BILA
MSTPNKSPTSVTTTAATTKKATTKKATTKTTTKATTKASVAASAVVAAAAPAAASATAGSSGCNNDACNNACINRGCQTGTCNLCSAAANAQAPCNTAFADGRCTCDFCTSTPCAQPDQITGTFFDKSNCKSIGCDSGDCFNGITLCVGCSADNTAIPSSVTLQTSAIGTCTPSACATFCKQHGCATGGCDLFYKNQASNPCACSTCISPSQICVPTTCDAACKATGFGCRFGQCNQGLCDCFTCPDNAAGK